MKLKKYLFKTFCSYVEQKSRQEGVIKGRFLFSAKIRNTQITPITKNNPLCKRLTVLNGSSEWKSTFRHSEK